MRFANIEKSNRLQRVLAYMRRKRRPVSTLEIITGAGVCAVNSCICELRRNGYKIPPAKKMGGVYYYVLK